MSFLEIAGQRLTVPVGESKVGSHPNSQIVLSGPGIAPDHAVLHGFPDGQVSIRKAAEHLEVMVNGVRLGPQPTPLLHGDKVEVGLHEMLFVDERRSGSTQFVQAISPASMAASGKKPTGQRAPTAATGGRLVCLTDGREYTITSASLIFGRDASCDVVVTGKDVSRRHAEILVSPKGYVLVDSSTNGTYVNGQRIQGQHLLARADVVRVGTDEFRFYADAAAVPAAAPAPAPGAERRLADTLHGVPGVAPPPKPAAAAPAPPLSPPAVEPAPVPVSAGPVVAPRLAEVAPPAAPAPAAAPAAQAPDRSTTPGRSSGGDALAYIVVRSGLLKGQRLAIRVPVVNIGRADYNDLMIPDDSVSTIHAKIQRREGLWVLSDLDSTNGTLVDGERVGPDAPLSPGAYVRFGDVQTVFEPADDDVASTKGGSTRMMSAVKLPKPPGA